MNMKEISRKEADFPVYDLYLQTNLREKSFYHMKIFFIAFSFEHDPHIIVVILFKPFGATDIKTFCKRFGQSAPGNTPSAGRFTKAKIE